MKKEYVRPFIEVVRTKTENLMAGHSYDHADGKQGNFFDDEENEMSEPWKSKRYNLWEE